MLIVTELFTFKQILFKKVFCFFFLVLKTKPRALQIVPSFLLLGYTSLAIKWLFFCDRNLTSVKTKTSRGRKPTAHPFSKPWSSQKTSMYSLRELWEELVPKFHLTLRDGHHSVSHLSSQEESYVIRASVMASMVVQSPCCPILLEAPQHRAPTCSLETAFYSRQGGGNG